MLIKTLNIFTLLIIPFYLSHHCTHEKAQTFFIFTLRVVKDWDRFSREVSKSPSLEMLGTALAGL